ncbi:MAG: hypothetical protein AAF843_03075 [Bacteroidota bacterium]
MNCLIDNSLTYSLRKGKRAEVIRRYIRLKYRINMDMGALKERIKTLSSSDLELA